MADPQQGFFWVVSPDVIAKGIEQYGDKALVAVKGVGDDFAQRIQDYSRQHAPWHDRTGNARRGLFGVADQEGAVTYIYLSHTVKYGVWLEIGGGGKWAIIMPTVEKNLPTLQSMLNDLFRD